MLVTHVTFILYTVHLRHMCCFSLRLVISTRDLMSWILFFNKTVVEQTLNPPQAFFHGACLIFMDSLPTDSKLYAGLHQATIEELKSILSRWGQDLEEQPVAPSQPAKEDQMESDKQSVFGIHPFFLQLGQLALYANLCPHG